MSKQEADNKKIAKSLMAAVIATATLMGAGCASTQSDVPLTAAEEQEKKQQQKARQKKSSSGGSGGMSGGHNGCG